MRPYKVLFPINVVEELVKPVTLALRLFGNIFSGAVLLLIIATPALAKWIAPIPILDTVWKLFAGVFVGPSRRSFLVAHDPLLPVGARQRARLASGKSH